MARLLVLLLLSSASAAMAQPHGQLGHVQPFDGCPGATKTDAPSAFAGETDVSPATTWAAGVVTRVYADLAAGRLAAVAAVLDDHVMWVDGADRLVGRAAVAARLAALADGPPQTFAAERPGLVVATGRAANGWAVRTVWRLVDGHVTGIERSPATDL